MTVELPRRGYCVGETIPSGQPWRMQAAAHSEATMVLTQQMAYTKTSEKIETAVILQDWSDNIGPASTVEYNPTKYSSHLYPSTFDPKAIIEFPIRPL